MHMPEKYFRFYQIIYTKHSIINKIFAVRLFFKVIFFFYQINHDEQMYFKLLRET